MDAFRIHEPDFEAADDELELAGYDEPQPGTPPAPDPHGFGQDERRMQVRVYNYWASLLDGRRFPSVEDLDPESNSDFGPHSVLLDCTSGIENPAISFLGERLATGCDVDRGITGLAEVPTRSLLTRLTDHYMQIFANEAPIGFEAEFLNQAGETLLYRGIMLPFSSDDDTIDFIFGVINWKIDDAQPALAPAPFSAELPKAAVQVPVVSARREPALPPPLALPAADHELGLYGDAIDFDQPAPRSSIRFDAASDLFDPAPAPAPGPAPASQPAIEPGLSDLLAEARDLAHEAGDADDRSRKALYQALGRAYAFSCAAARDPAGFDELLAGAGLTVQARAPMTPVVKLVFGADHDKTRLTEYAACLAHAHRIGLEAGALPDHLAAAKGGLKAVVAAERALRRELSGTAKPVSRKGLRTDTADQLRALPVLALADLPAQGEEFALVLARRMGDGSITMIGEVAQDAALLERAARSLLG